MQHDMKYTLAEYMRDHAAHETVRYMSPLSTTGTCLACITICMREGTSLDPWVCLFTQPQECRPLLTS